MPHSPLMRFYLGRGPDNQGRMLEDILSWNNEQLENTHDYIQWLFPLKEKSSFNDSAPLVTEEDIVAFRGNIDAKHNLFRASLRMLKFYGFRVCFTVSGEGYEVMRSETFDEESRHWLKVRNHNFLRITRMLKSLVLLGFPAPYPRTILAALERVYGKNADIIGEETLRYWREAAVSD